MKFCILCTFCLNWAVFFFFLILFCVYFKFQFKSLKFQWILGSMRSLSKHRKIVAFLMQSKIILYKFLAIAYAHNDLNCVLMNSFDSWRQNYNREIELRSIEILSFPWHFRSKIIWYFCWECRACFVPLWMEIQLNTSLIWNNQGSFNLLILSAVSLCVRTNKS